MERKRALPTRLDHVEFTPGALDAMFHAGQAGWNLYLIGNEDAVAQGKLSEAKWKELRGALAQHLQAHGIPLKRFYACLDHPDGVKGHARDSVFLLPNTGVLYHAAQTDGIVLPQSWVIGDSSLELVAGWRAGCRLAGVRTGEGLADNQLHVEPEIHEATLAVVLNAITRDSRIASPYTPY